MFEKLSETTSGLEFYQVDVDEENEIAGEVGITSMPTFVAFEDGQEVDRMVGVNTSNLIEMVEQLVDGS